MIDLRTATVRQGKRKNGHSFISITNRMDETIMITYDDPVKFERWSAVFAESVLQDDQLYQLQIVPKLQEEERKLKAEQDSELHSQISMFKSKKKEVQAAQKLLYCGSFLAAKLEADAEIAKDNWKTLEELAGGTRY